MLNIDIIKVEQDEEIVIITAAIHRLYWLPEEPYSDVDKKALAVHQGKLLELQNLHLGAATLSQARVE